MLSINELKDYLEELKEAIPALKSSYLVIDDSQVGETLKEHRESGNLILYGFIPSHKGLGQTADDARVKDLAAFMVLRKVDRNQRHDTFIENMATCQAAANAIYKKMLEDMHDDEHCYPFTARIDIASIEINPVWQLAGADGYDISFSLLSNL